MKDLTERAYDYIEASERLTAFDSRTRLSERLDTAVHEKRYVTALGLGTASIARALPFFYHGIRFSLACERNRIEEILPLDDFEDFGDNSQSLAQARAIIFYQSIQ